MPNPLRAPSLLIVGLLAGAACGSSTEPSVPTTIQVNPSSVAFTSVTQPEQLTATVRDQNGQAMADATVSWTSVDVSVVTVGPSGTVTGAGEGETTVRATSGQASVSVPASVLQRPDTVQFASASLTLGGPTDQVQVAAEVLDELGAPISSLAPTLTSSDEAVVTVSPAGVATAVSVGSAIITAEVERDGDVANGSVAVTVDAPPELTPSEVCSAFPDYAVASFGETVVADTLVSLLELTDAGDLTCGRIAALELLDAGGLGIVDLAGMQNLTGLLELRLGDNAVVDLEPLSELENLDTLVVDGNQIADLTPLYQLNGLTLLDASRNQLTILGPQGVMSGLQQLDVSENQVRDVTAVSGMPDLQSLDLDQNALTSLEKLLLVGGLDTLSAADNELTDLAGVQTHAALATLDVSGNAGLADITALLNHPGLGPGGEISLEGTAVSCIEVALVETSGVMVSSDCPVPDQAIAFSSARDGDQEIYTMKLNGTDPVQLTDHPATDEAPQWSPDGTKIVFMSDRDGDYEIYTMDADGSNLLQLTDNASNDRWPAWSPDGSQIAFQGNGVLTVMNPDGSGAFTVSTGLGSVGSPSWSPDGMEVAVAASVDGNRDIFRTTLGGSTTRLTTAPESEFDPDWSPDGAMIAYSRAGVGTDDVYVMASDGTNQVKLSDEGPNSYFTDWSPDGGWIVFSSNREDQSTHLYVMKPDGSHVVRLGESAGFGGFWPSWR